MDLTKSILKAKDYLKDVQIEEFLSNIKNLANSFDFLIDWDKDDGEQWGRFLHEQKVIALFSSKVPLIFIDVKFHVSILHYFEDNKIDNFVIIKVESWEATNNSINLSEVYDIITWNSSMISKEKFSINDFWYATV